MSPAQTRSRRRRRGWARLRQRPTRRQVVLGVLAVVVLLIVIVVVQAFRATSALREASSQSSLLQGQIVSGDERGARASLATMRDATEVAHDSTDGILWAIGAKVPFLGRNVEAVRTVSRVLDDVANDALPPVVGLTREINLDTFSPRDGTIDLAAIAEIAPSIQAADEALTEGQRELDEIDPGSLLTPLRSPIASVQLRLDAARRAADATDVAAQLMPTMLGEDGPRTYLLMIQNNAEIRPTGGIAGSFALIEADGGTLTMGEQGSGIDIPPFTDPVVELTDDERSVFPTSLADDFRDVTITPDFPRSAEIARALVQEKLDVEVDGVLSVDPVALGYLLEGTGPVQLSDDTQLTAANAVDILLNGIYLEYEDVLEQDEIFESSARTIFDVVRAGSGTSRTVIDGMVRAADENRLMLWSADPAEQERIAATGLAGGLAGDDGRTPHVGIYYSDAGSSKMEYYFGYSTTVTARRCLDDDVQEITTTSRLTSNAPPVGDLTPSITGDGRFSPKGTVAINMRLYSPFDGLFTKVEVDGRPVTPNADRHLGRNVTRVGLTILPGEVYTVTTTMRSGPGQDLPGVFSTTPGLQSTRNDVTIPSACD